jgi:hypothetical protein
MKILKLLLVPALLATTSLGQETFPGLKSVLTEAEWQRAGLDRLTPDQIGVIDAALMRQQARAIGESKAAAVTQQRALESATPPVAQGDFANNPQRPRGWLERFGLPVFSEDDWRNLPPLKSKVVAWAGGNRFRLENGQLWEGFERIPYELVGREISIHARPGNQYALSVEGNNTTVRVLRLR